MSTEDGTLSPVKSRQDTSQSIHEKGGNSAPPPSAPPARSTLKNIVLISTVTLAQVLNISNTSVVSISLPTIGKELNIAESKLQWLASAFALSSGCLLLLLGRAADLYGRKRAFILGCMIMGMFGLASGFAQNEVTIDVLRGFQGIGPAAAVPAALGILAHTFPPSHLRAVAFSTFAAGAPIGGAVGQILGGVFTQVTKETWRSTFWLLSGLAALCCVGAAVSIDPDEPYQFEDRRLDWIGALLVTAGLTLIIFVLSDGSVAPNGWKTSYIIALLIVGVVLVVLFVTWEHFLERVHEDPQRAFQKWWTPPPLMPVSIWTRSKGQLAAVFLIAFLEMCSFNSFTLWLQLYYQDYAGLTPILTMVRIIPMFISGVCCNIVIALVVSHVPLVILISIGTLFTGVACLLFAVINPALTYWAFGFPAVVLCVFGADFVFATGTLFTAKVCRGHEQSLGGALFQTVSQIGTSFGLAITTIAFDATVSRHRGDAALTGAQGGAPLQAYKNAMWAGFSFAACGSIVALLVLRGVGIVGHRKAPSDGENGHDTTCHKSVEN